MARKNMFSKLLNTLNDQMLMPSISGILAFFVILSCATTSLVSVFVCHSTSKKPGQTPAPLAANAVAPTQLGLVDALISWLDSQQPSGVNKCRMLDMIQRSNLRDNFVVVITGATGGLGKSISQAVLELGGLVVAVDCDEMALKSFQDQDPDHIKIVVSDFADLENVSRAADTVLQQVAQIDVLVNNAGITYPMKSEQVDLAGASIQNYDLLFQMNYFSHFLLTERLLPTLSSGRVVQVALSFSWGVDGSGLVRSMSGVNPAASCSGSDRLSRHISFAYPNSNLAQIWYAAQLNCSGKVTPMSACPS